MPYLLLPVPNLRVSVERPIIYSVLRRLMDITRISHKTAIRFYGDEAIAAQQNSTITGSNAANNGLLRNTGERNVSGLGENIWPYTEQINIEVEEEFRKERLGAMVTNRPGVKPVFEDKAIGVYIKPVYTTTDITIRIKYLASDKNAADMWRNQLRGLSAMQLESFLHQLDYHYCIIPKYLDLLEEVYRLRENVGGYGDTLEDYVGQRLSGKVSVVSDFAGIGKALVVGETQGRVIGRFDFEGSPEKAERVDNQSAYAVSCNYKFSYEKPIEMAMSYPIMIHNQLIDKPWRPNSPAYNPLNNPQERNIGYADWRQLESDDLTKAVQAPEGLQIPSFDTYHPSAVIDSTVRVMSMLIRLDEADRTTLFNFKDLGKYSFEKIMLDFIASERSFMTKNTSSIFCLSLYENNYLMPFDSLTVDDDLNVKSTLALDIRKTYRVRLGLYTNILALKPSARKRMRLNTNITKRLAMAIDGTICNKGSVVGIMKNKLRGEEYEEMGLRYEGDYGLKGQPMDGLLPGHGRTKDMRNLKLVQVFFVEAMPMSMAATSGTPAQ